MSADRIPATGPSGEAVVVIKSWVDREGVEGGVVPDAVPTYRLDTGESLRLSDTPGVLQSLDGKQRFKTY